MTTAEQIIDLSNKMRELRQKRAELIKIRQTESEFKVGEKVNIFDDYGSGEVNLGHGIVNSIRVKASNADFYYTFRQITKFGNESKLMIPTQGKVRLEKID